jgi:SAM-dependent methyltransferase
MPNAIDRNKQAWDDLGDLDPFFAILSHPSQQYGRWDLEEFFRTGEEEVGRLMETAGRLGIPRQRREALDFGCGVGRLTRALTHHFEKCLGVDISNPMVERARELNADNPGCSFIINVTDDLRILPDGKFDLIYTNVVLQHVPDQRAIRSYIREFARVLATGGLLAFQLPSHIGWKRRLQPRARLYGLLRTVGVNHRFLYERLHINPMRMNFLAAADVEAILTSSGVRLLQSVEADRSVGGGMRARVYFATRDSESPLAPISPSH